MPRRTLTIYLRDIEGEPLRDVRIKIGPLEAGIFAKRNEPMGGRTCRYLWFLT